MFFFFVFSSLCLYSVACTYTGLVQRCVIIQKDDNGFGLTVSGDNPVFVQSVKEGKPFFQFCLLLANRIRIEKIQ